MSETTLTLDTALDCGNSDLRDELIMREPTCGEVVKALKCTGIELVMMLLGLQNGLAQSIISKLPISKIAEATNYYVPFLSFGPETTAD